MKQALFAVLLLSACAAQTEDDDDELSRLPNDECEAVCVEDVIELEPECIEQEAECVLECETYANLDCVFDCEQELPCTTRLNDCSNKCECRQFDLTSEEEAQCLEEFDFSPLDCAYRCQASLAMCRAECRRVPEYDENYSKCMDGCLERVLACENECVDTL